MTTVGEEARGIYVDLLGLRDTPPVLLSVLVDESFEQIVTDTAFGDAALARDLRVRAVVDELRDLLLRAAREQRRLFGFGPAHALVRWTPSLRGLSGHYDDVADLTRLWYEREGRSIDDRRDLAGFLDDLGQPIPGRLARRHTTSRLRHVQSQLQAHGAWTHLTPTAKGKWTKLLQQGESAVRGMRTLALAAAAGLAAPRR